MKLQGLLLYFRKIEPTCMEESFVQKLSQIGDDT
jgi:hypothetical protein